MIFEKNDFLRFLNYFAQSLEHKNFERIMRPLF